MRQDGRWLGTLNQAVKRHKHLWNQVASLNNLVAAAQAAMSGKRTGASGAAFSNVWETEVVKLERELRTGEYRPGEYHYFEILEPKRRMIAAAPFRDRVVHHALVRVLEPLFDPRFIEDSYACRTGKGTHAGMRRALFFSKRYAWVLKCDIRKYFPSIRHDLLLSKLERVVGDKQVLNLIALIVGSHSETVTQEWRKNGNLFDVKAVRWGLPIGNLTSQFFANIYMDAFDHYVKQGIRVKGYVRYVDDFLLFGEDRAELRRIGERCHKYLEGEGLVIHPDKYRMCRTADGVDFCGFVLRADGRVKVRSAGVRRFQRRLKQMRYEVSHGDLGWKEVGVSVRSWIAHAEHAQSWRLRSRILGG